MQNTTNPKQGFLAELGPFLRQFLPALLILSVIFLALFYKSFEKDVVLFSNDGPLGVQNSASLALPQAWHGIWYLSWIGASGNQAYASVTEVFRWLAGPVGFAKFYEPVSLMILGVCAWIFFRTLGLRNSLSIVGAIAAALNSNFFSNACWGLGSRAISLSCIFLALSALSAKRSGNPWLNAALAGLAVGMSVVEGADNGAIFSLCVSAFVVFQSFIEGGPFATRVVRSLRLILVALFAVWIAWQSVVPLFGFAKQGAVSAGADAQTQEQKWTFATQWSLPPAETLRVIIPGLYGYRMDGTMSGTEKVYWGRVGEDPHKPEALRRFSGSGEYAGLLVVLLALWSLIASFSKSSSVYSLTEKKLIWFWWVVVTVSVLLSWGRFAPLFYKVVYSLPYFSSIRNPIKFMHPAHMALMILFGYGLLGLSRRHLDASAQNGPSVARTSWWSKALPFERAWVWGVASVLLVSAVGYLIYSGSRESLYGHLVQSGFPDEGSAAGLAGKIASYSILEVGMYVVFLALSAGAIVFIMTGLFRGKKSHLAAILLGLVLTVDLGRAAAPWIVFWDYPYKYEIDRSKTPEDTTNPIVKFLKEKTVEGRLIAPPYLMDGRALSAAGGLNYFFPSVYGIEWVQHHFCYYDIQAMDYAQDPRPPADKDAYMKATMHDPVRYWQLTNTRYILGMTGFLDPLNLQLDKGRNRFRIVTTFTIQPKPGVQPSVPADFAAVIVSNGPLALFEFTGALPRTKLFSQWQVSTNDTATLTTLADPSFDPAATVLVSDEVPASTASTNTAPGTTEIVGYKPQRVEIHANATVPSVLLLNDRYDPDWHVTVDGRPARMLRCNFIMRGVELPPGEHTVVFEFKPTLKSLKISLAAMIAGLVLCVLLLFVRQSGVAAPNTATAPTGPTGKIPRK